MKKNKLIKMIPNILTTLRLAVVPLFCTLFIKEAFIAALIIYISACITDALDGYLARCLDAQSTYGKVIDPIADKTLVLSSLVLSTINNPLMIMPIVFESGIMLVNSIGMSKRINFHKMKKMNFTQKVEYMCQTVQGPTELGRAKTIPLMVVASLSVVNCAIGFTFTMPLNVLVVFTGVMESATFIQYFNMKILNKDVKDIKFLRLGSKTKEKTIDHSNENTNKILKENNIEEKPIENDFNNENTEMEMYKKLQKELEFLEPKNKNNNIKSKKYNLELEDKMYE